MDLALAGKAVLVTGGGSNIGRGICLAFVAEGSNVVIVDLDEDQARKVEKEANAMGAGGRVLVLKTDVTKLNEVKATFEKALAEFGKVDVLVNSVGWDIPQLFTETTPELWEKIISLNYRHQINCIHTVLPHMIERKYGSIVSIGSDAGRVGEFKESIYAGCKAGVIALSKAIAREVGRYGIRLNVVCPGLTAPKAEDFGKDSMWKDLFPVYTPEILEKAAKNYPLRRIGKAEDIAKAVLFLASDAASFITGQTLSVSGGYSMM